MNAAMLGVAVMGAIYALCHGGAQGLRVALLCGAAVQLACAAIAWRHGTREHG